LARNFQKTKSQPAGKCRQAKPQAKKAPVKLPERAVGDRFMGQSKRIRWSPHSEIVDFAHITIA
jgi:hypothetical protein